MMQSLAAGLCMFAVLVVIHELGHFVFAKWFGVGVPVFSVGMGPRLFGFKRGGTDYRVSMFPLGGYVQMSGADPFGEEDPDVQVPPDEDFMKKPVWQRLVILLGGPGFNLILPFVVFTGVLMLGEPQASPEFGEVYPDSPAMKAGIQTGDVVTQVGEQEVETFSDFAQALMDADEGPIMLRTRRGTAQHTVLLPDGIYPFMKDGRIDLDAFGAHNTRPSSRIGVSDSASMAGLLGLRTGDEVLRVDGAEVHSFRDLKNVLEDPQPHALEVERMDDGSPTLLTIAWPTVPNSFGTDIHGLGIDPVNIFVGDVVPDSPAERAGVQANDRLLRVNGQAIDRWHDLTGLVGRSAKSAGDTGVSLPLALDVQRDGVIHQIQLTPEVEREVVQGEVRYRPIMGVVRYEGSFVAGPKIRKYYSFAEAVPRAIQEGVFVFNQTMKVLSNLITGELYIKESLGGPVAIFQAAGEGAKRGIFSYARLIATISFSLGIINLLPVPVLDGGQIIFYSIEGIRGRPLSLNLREKIQMIGVLALVALMIIVTALDVQRWITGG